MIDYKKVKDSGTRQKFKTGAVRDIQQGKGRFDLISPIFLRRLARHYENGAVKYGDWNWSKGIPIGRFLDSALRHINEYREGLKDEDHLSAGAWNLASAIHTEEMIEHGLLPKELMDIPNFTASTSTISESDLAYAAGIIDGEGCIKIYHAKKETLGKGHVRDRYQLQIQVDMVKSEVVNWLQSKFGGTVYEHRRSIKKHPTWNDSKRWYLMSKDEMTNFLGMILPYLKIKRKQAELALQFLGLPRKSELKKEFWNEMSSLNKTGREAHPYLSSKEEGAL